MKIKTKKQLNLPQLIEWAWDNDIKNETFIADKQLTNIEFDDTGDVLIYGNDNKKTVKFTIEVEEEITEDTVIPKMVEIYLDRERDFDFADVHLNQSINKVKDDYEFGCKSLTFHKMNDDGTHTLIWRDGKLIKE
ncbi:hypothetical protein ISO30_02870 [Staphylococcus saprophyticus]|uniref:hypothetical protein n=1 Tax=Staphylococcus saprophyticus TaxID=29385 RepID=UPI0018881C6B|nr:hypothetical protein [Staphylococcus saprophyticus]MBF2780683.1 hypothetical protein [Staphylococcus saprophyticus]